MKKQLSIIIILTNDRKWIRRCFESLQKQTFRDFEIVVVDNDTRDGSIEYIQKNFSQMDIRIARSQANLGFAGGNNFGVKNSTGELVMLLNPDVWMKEDFLHKILNFYRKNSYDAVGVLEGDYKNQSLKNSHFYTRIDPFGHTISLPKKNNEDQFNICGCCMLVSKKLYEESGGLDKDFFIYVEEIDWCWRLHLLGKKVGLAENAILFHAGTADGKKPKYFTFLCRNRNIPQMLLKNYAWPNLFWTMPLYFLQNVFEVLFFLLTGKPKFAWSYIEGWISTARNFSQIMEKRKRVQKMRRVGDWEIMKKYFYFGNAKLHHLISFYGK